MIDIVVRDKRVTGNPPKTTNDRVVFNIDENTSIDSVITMLAFFCQKGSGYRNIIIIAHGIVNAKNYRGGLGLELGKEHLTLDNVHKWGALSGKVKEIIIYSCAAAGVQVGMANEPKHGNGVYLCSQLAFYSGAVVTASTEIQMYLPGVLSLVWDIEMDFGQWEGTVLHFFPNGQVGTADGKRINPIWKGKQWTRQVSK